MTVSAVASCLREAFDEVSLSDVAHERVFDFLHRVEHGLPVRMYGLGDAGARAFDLGTATAAVDDRLQQVAGDVRHPIVE